MRLFAFLLLVGCTQSGLDRYTAERCFDQFRDVYSVPNEECLKIK